MKEQDYIKIYRCLSGLASEEEMAELTAWQQASAENKRNYDELAIAWEASGQVVFPEFDVEEALAAMPFNQQPTVSSGNGTGKSGNRLLRLVTSAAAILAIGIVAWLYTDQSQQGKQEYHGNITDRLTLSDGTLVHLREDAVLRVPEKFSGKNRKIQMIQGEAYFDVASDPERPFRIESAICDIQVLGTSFSVDLADDHDSLYLHVAEGKVRVIPADSDETLDVATGNALLVEDTPNRFVMAPLKNPDINLLAWHTGVFQFNNTPLHDVIEVVEHSFRVEVDERECKSLNCPVSMDRFPAKSAMEVLDAVSDVFFTELVQIDEDDFLLKGGFDDCPPR